MSPNDLLRDFPEWTGAEETPERHSEWMPRRFRCQRETILHWLRVGLIPLPWVSKVELNGYPISDEHLSPCPSRRKQFRNFSTNSRNQETHGNALGTTSKKSDGSSETQQGQPRIPPASSGVFLESIRFHDRQRSGGRGFPRCGLRSPFSRQRRKVSVSWR